MKKLITLEACGIFILDFVYKCILTLSLVCRTVTRLTKHKFGLLSALSEKAHNS